MQIDSFGNRIDFDTPPIPDAAFLVTVVIPFPPITEPQEEVRLRVIHDGGEFVVSGTYEP